MIKSLALSPGELFGGVERQILDVVSANGSVVGLETQAGLFHHGKLADRLEELGAPGHMVQSRSKYDPSAAGRLSKLCSQEGVDILHCHGYRAAVTAAVAGILEKPLPPVIKTEHGMPEPIAGHPFQRMKSSVNHRLDRWATRRACASVCYVTRDIHDRFDEQHHGLDRHVVPNGIAPISSGNYGMPDDLPRSALLLGVVGRVSEVKGLNDLLQAVSLEAFPADTRIAVLGTGPLEASLKARAAAAGLADRVIFLGFRTNIHDYIAHIDALLMPSLHEGLPYTLLEAMSLGKPVLASDVGGLAEVLRDNETGLLFPSRDPAAIARAVRRLVDEPDLGPRLGAAAARVQRERYTLDAMLDRYVEIYREAIARRTA